MNRFSLRATHLSPLSLLLCTLMLGHLTLAQTRPTPVPTGGWRKVETPGQDMARRILKIEVAPSAKIADITKKERFKEVDAYAKTNWLDTGVAEDPLQPYWEGAATYSASATLGSTGQNVFSPQKYQWLAGGTLGPGSDQAEDDADTTPESKRFVFDFGQVTLGSLDQFPRSTIVQVAVVDGAPNSEAAPLIAKAKVNWHLPPQMVYNVEIQFNFPDDGSPNDIWELIDEKQWRDQMAIKVGANATVQALNTIYFDQARDLMYMPLYLGGFHVLAQIRDKVWGLARPMALALRERKAARRVARGLADDIVGSVTISINGVRETGTLSTAEAALHTTTDAGHAAQLTESTSQAAQAAERAATAADDAVTKSHNAATALHEAGEIAASERAVEKATRAQSYAQRARTAAGEAAQHNAQMQRLLPELQDAARALREAKEVGGVINQWTKMRGLRRTAHELSVAAELSARCTSVSISNSGRAARLGEEIRDLTAAAGKTHEAQELGHAVSDVRAHVGTGNQYLAQTNTVGPVLWNRTSLSTRRTEIVLPRCFVAGTSVTMADGTSKPIEQIRVGDLVLSRAEDGSQTEARTVKRLYQHQVGATLLLHFSSFDIETTAGHPFYVAGKGFVPAGEMGIGTSIVTRAGPSAQVLGIERKSGLATVYNFEIEGLHTYFVGNFGGGLWAHNDCGETAGKRVAKDHAFRIHGGDIGGEFIGHPQYGTVDFFGSRLAANGKITEEDLAQYIDSVVRGHASSPDVVEHFRDEVESTDCYFHNGDKVIVWVKDADKVLPGGSPGSCYRADHGYYDAKDAEALDKLKQKPDDEDFYKIFGVER